MLHSKIRRYLDELNQAPELLGSYDYESRIAQEIKIILEQDEGYDPTKEDIAEQIAFSFISSDSNGNSDRGTYYRSMVISFNTEGKIVDCSNNRPVDLEETLIYWANRARESEYPLLSSRYADLVVDFSQKVLKRRIDIDLFQIVIDSNIAICEESLIDSLDCKTKIKRALILAIQINDQERINRIKNTIIELERDIAIDDKPGLWGFAFQWLILDFSRKVTLGDTEKKEIINEIETRLERVKQEPSLTERSVSLLAEYYARKKDETSLMQVLRVLENSLKTK